VKYKLFKIGQIKNGIYRCVGNTPVDRYAGTNNGNPVVLSEGKLLEWTGDFDFQFPYICLHADTGRFRAAHIVRNYYISRLNKNLTKTES
jgi:hypothetical protein